MPVPLSGGKLPYTSAFLSHSSSNRGIKCVDCESLRPGTSGKCQHSRGANRPRFVFCYHEFIFSAKLCGRTLEGASDAVRATPIHTASHTEASTDFGMPRSMVEVSQRSVTPVPAVSHQGAGRDRSGLVAGSHGGWNLRSILVGFLLWHLTCMKDSRATCASCKIWSQQAGRASSKVWLSSKSGCRLLDASFCAGLLHSGRVVDVNRHSIFWLLGTSKGDGTQEFLVSVFPKECLGFPTDQGSSKLYKST